ncbi:MAG: hypothetical protein AAF483_22045 [Planctomycetota bacterium]
MRKMLGVYEHKLVSIGLPISERAVKCDSSILERRKVECVVDTGFNGFLSLPMPLVSQLGLKLGAGQSGITGAVKSGYFDAVRTTILWLDEEKSFQAQVLDEELLAAECYVAFVWRLIGFLMECSACGVCSLARCSQTRGSD